MLALANKLTNSTQPIYRFVNKYSIDFDGVDDRIITDGADTVAQPTTYSFWCKSSTTGANKGVFGHGDANIGAFHFNFSSDKPLLYLGSGDFINWDISGDQQDDGEWHHWVVYSDTNDITNSKLYVDGVLQTPDSVASAGNISAYTESLTIGSDRQVGGNSFEGKIDEFAVYDRELTQDEITRMYNTYYSPNRVANGNFSQIGNEEVTNGDFSQIGSELVTNGNFATDSDWTKIGNATIQNGYAELTFDGTTGNQIRQTTLTSGKIYKVQYEILSNTGTDGQVFMNAFSNGTAIDISVGTYTLYLTAINTTFFNFRTLGGTGGSVQIDNVSVKEVGQDWSFGTGITIENEKAFFNDSAYPQAIEQTNIATIGKQYKVSFTVSDFQSGTVKLRHPFEVSGVQADGDYVFYGEAASTGITLRGDGVPNNFKLDNISVKEVGQHWNQEGTWNSTNYVEFNGSLARLVTDGTGVGISQTCMVIGREYKLTFDVIAAASGSAKFDGASINFSSVGSYSTTFTASQIGLTYYRNSGAADITIDNVVLQELKHDATNLMLNAGAYQSANPLITSTKSMEFDGIDDYLDVSNSFNYISDFSLAVWLKAESTHSNYEAIMSKYSGNTGYDMIMGLGKIRMAVRGSSNIDTGNVGNDLRDGNWHYVVAAVTNSSIKIYVDGALTNTSTGTWTPTTNTANFKIGFRDGIDEFNGKMTEVGTWDRTLTALEVASLYNQGMPTNLLVNRNNYQSGNPTVFNTKQVDFDGTDDHLKVTNAYGSFTGSISAWVKRDSLLESRYITDFRSGSGTGYFAIASNHTVAVSNGTKYVDGVATTTVPQDNEWHHIVVTGITLNITESIIFGSRYNIIDVFDGDMSQVGLWNSTLTADEVSSLYNHGLPIDLSTDQAAYESSSNLVGYWRMGSGTLDTYPLIADQTNATLGSELVTNGDFELNSGWLNFGSPTTSEQSTEQSHTGTYSWKIIADATQEGIFSPNNFNLTSGLTYSVSLWIYSVSGNSIKSGLTNTNVSVFAERTVTVGEWTNITYIATASSTGAAYVSILSQNSLNFFVDDVSIKQVNGNPAIMTNQTSSDIENGSPYANVVQNGTFDTDTNWTKGTGWTIANGLASCDGTQSSQSNLYQAGIVPINITYKATFTMTVSAGSMVVAIGGSNAQPTKTESGTYTFISKATSGDSNFYFSASSDFVGSIDNVTVEEVNTGLQGYWKMGDGTNDEYPVIYDQTNPTLGSEVVTNGNFSNGTTDWTNNGTSVLSVSSGIMTIDRNSSGVANQCYQDLTTVNGSQYILSINQIAASHGIQLNIGGTTYANFPVTLGIRRILFTASSTTTRISINASDSSTATAQIDNVLVKLVSGNPATMTNMVEGNITNQYPLTKIRNYYRMGDGILDGYPIIQDQTSPNLAHIPTTNLLYNSEDFSAWQTESGNQTVTPNAATSPIGTSNASKLTVHSTSSVPARKLWIYGASPMVSGIVAGKPYAFSVYIKKVSGQVNTGFLHITTGANDTFAASTSFTATDEWQRVSVAVNSLVNSLARFYITGDSNAQLFIWGGQVEQQAQSTPYIKSENSVFGVRKATTTNLITYSEDFSQSSWNLDGNNIYITRTPNAAISPSGNNDATKLITNNISKSPTYAYIGNSGLSATEPYTISVFAKKGEYDYLVLGNGGYGTGFYSVFNLSSGVISTQPSASSTFANIEDYSNGWYRCSVVTNNTSSGEMLYITPSVDGTITTNYTGTANGIYVWGAQAEEQTQAENYAKTTGLPVTIDLFTENNYGTMTNMSASDIVEDTP